ncbi:hypothetical protein MTsDn1_22190 [Alteromonas sp. MTD1]
MNTAKLVAYSRRLIFKLQKNIDADNNTGVMKPDAY